MAGANYMGGRRNSARARTKDAAGRAQKSHFMKQRHQILAHGLRNHSPDDIDKDRRPAQSGRIEEIAFAHARRDLQQNGISTNCTLKVRAPTFSLLPSSSPSSNKQYLLRNSNILEDLDINEPSGLRATLQRILRQPDLAGIRRLNVKSASPEKPRKRLKTGEDTPTDSSSSFLYDSPTRKGGPGELQPLNLTQRFPRSSNVHSRSDVHAHSSSAHNGNSAVGSDSFGSSLDRISIMQEVGSSSSHPDSGFSELLFSDTGDKEQSQSQPKLLEHPGANTGTGRRKVPSSPGVPSGQRSSDKPSHKKLSVRTLQKPVTDKSFQPKRTDGDLCSSYESTRAHIRTTSNPEDFDDWPTLNNDFVAQVSSERSAERAAEGRENCRYGVGYVPSDPKVDYRPFVPVSTMLPSYSDEESVDDDIHRTNESALDAGMDIDIVRIEMNNPLVDGIQFVRKPASAAIDVDETNSLKEHSTEEDDLERLIETSSYIAHAKSDASSSRSVQSRTSQFALQTPPRRFARSPTRRSSSTHRSRFTFPTEHSVSSILGDGDRKDHDIFVSPKAMCLDSPGSSVLSKSLEIFTNTFRRGGRSITTNSLHSNNGSPHHGLANSFSIQAAQKSPSTISPQVPHTACSPDVNLVALPKWNSDQEPAPSPRIAEGSTPAPQVFDGPNLFVDGEDDDE